MDSNPDAELTPDAFGVDVLLARAGWLRVQDDIHGGLCHSLNGRVSSLDGLLHILHMDESAEVKVMGFIEDETTRLAEIVATLRRLSGVSGREVEALRPEDLLEQAAALHRCHRGLENLRTHVTVAGDTPPVRTSPPRLLRVLLIVLSRLGQAAMKAKAPGLNVLAQAEDGRVAFRFSVHGGDGETPVAELDGVAEPLRSLLALDQGELTSGARGVLISLPALTRAAL